jgi:hypothetical protein
VQQNKSKTLARKLLLTSGMVLAMGGCSAEPSKAATEGEKKAWELPTFTGEKPTHFAPEKPATAGELPDPRKLYDTALGCWPAQSFFKAEVTVEGRLRSDRVNFVDETSMPTGASRAAVALVARIPLYSAKELDREREREYMRRVKLADAVGVFYTALTDRERARRELALMRAMERRAQERVKIGVGETAEQVRYLEKVSGIEGELLKLRGQIEKSRLELIGHCSPTAGDALDRVLVDYIGVK